MSLVISMEDSGGQDVNIEVHPDEVFETFVLRASEILGYEVALSSITGEKEVCPSDNIYDFLMGMAVPEDEDEETMMDEDAGSQPALTNSAEIEDGELLTNPDGSLVQLAFDEDHGMMVEGIEDESMLDAVEHQESMLDVLAEQQSMLNDGDSQGSMLSYEVEKQNRVDNEVLKILSKVKAEEESRLKKSESILSFKSKQESIQKDVLSILDKVQKESRAIDKIKEKRVIEKTVIEVKRGSLSDDDYRSADEKPYDSMSSDMDDDEIEFLEEHLEEEEEEEGEFMDEEFADDDVDDFIEQQLLKSGPKPKIIATIREEKPTPIKPKILGVIRDETEKRSKSGSKISQSVLKKEEKPAKGASQMFGSGVRREKSVRTYGRVPAALESKNKAKTLEEDKVNDEIIMTVIEQIDDAAESETNNIIVKQDLPLVEEDDEEFTEIEFLDEEILEHDAQIIRSKISPSKPGTLMDLEDDITSYTIVKHERLDDDEIVENKRNADKIKKIADEKIADKLKKIADEKIADQKIAEQKKDEKVPIKKEDKKKVKKKEKVQDNAIKVEQVYTRKELLDLLEGDSDKSDSGVETKIQSIKDSDQFKITKTMKRKASEISPPTPVKDTLKKNNKTTKKSSTFASSNLSTTETQKILNIIKSVRQPEVKVMKLSDKEIDSLTTKEKSNLKRSEKENYRNSNGIEEAKEKLQVQEASDELYADLSKIFGLEKESSRRSKSSHNLLKYSRIKTEEEEEEDVDGALSGEDTMVAEGMDDYVPVEDLEWGRTKNRGTPAFVCRLCGQNLYRAMDAITHALFHKIPDKAIFPCIVCQYGFTSFPEVRKHIRSAHVDRRSPRRSLEASQSAKAARSRPGPMMIKTEPQDDWLDEGEVIVLEEWLDEEEEEMVRQAMEIRKPDTPVHHIKQEKRILQSEEEDEEEVELEVEQEEDSGEVEMEGLEELQELLQLGGRTKRREWLHCNYCKRKYDSPQHLARHKCTGAASGDCQRCALCGQAFHTNRRLMFHRTFHQAELIAMGLSCDRCGEKDFKNEVSLYDHINLSHNTSFFCPEPGCGKDFRLRSSLKSHGRIHGKKRQLRCDVCGKQFFDTQNLKEHKISHLKVKPFQCHICLKFVNRRSRLRMHLLAHEARPELNAVLACRCCKMAFRTTLDAENHVKESTICRENIEQNQVSGLELLAEAEKLQLDEERRDQVEIDLEKLLGEAVHGDVMTLQEDNQDCRTIEEVLKDHQDLAEENSRLHDDLHEFQQEIVEDYQSKDKMAVEFSESIIEEGIDADVDLNQDVEKVLEEIMEGATNKMEREEVECTKAEGLAGCDGVNATIEISIAEQELGVDQSKIDKEVVELGSEEIKLEMEETDLGLQETQLNMEGTELSSQETKLITDETELSSQETNLNMDKMELDSQETQIHMEGSEINLQETQIHIDGSELGLEETNSGMRGSELGLEETNSGMGGSELSSQEIQSHMEGSELGLEETKSVGGSDLGLQETQSHVEGSELGLDETKNNELGLEETEETKSVGGSNLGSQETQSLVEGSELGLEETKSVGGSDLGSQETQSHAEGSELGLEETISDKGASVLGSQETQSHVEGSELGLKETKSDFEESELGLKETKSDFKESELGSQETQSHIKESELGLQETQLDLDQSVEQQLQEAGILLDAGEVGDGVQQELKDKDEPQATIENNHIEQLDGADYINQSGTDTERIEGTEEELLEQLEASQHAMDIQKSNLTHETGLGENEICETGEPEFIESVENLNSEQDESILALPSEEMDQTVEMVELEVSAVLPDMIEINVAHDQETAVKIEENIAESQRSEEISSNFFDVEDADDPGEVEQVVAVKKTSQELEAELTPLGRLCIEAVNIKMVYRCEFCERVFSQKEALNEHRLIHQNVKLPYICNVCNEAYSTYARVTSHKTTHGFYRANIEDGPHERSASKMSGYEEFPVVKHFLCQVCSKTFLHWTYLQVHRKNKHAEMAQVFSCKLCGEQFTESWMLNHHRRKVHVEAVNLQRKTASNTFYKCADCGENFSMRKELAKHRDTEHDDRSLLVMKSKPGPFSCTECDKVYQTKVGLEGHMRIHNGGVYLCDLCGNGFAHRAGLETHHKRVHLREQPHSCEICNQSFFSSAELFGHRRCHTGEKPFPCNFCPMYFRTKGRRNEHHRVHTGERPYPCDLCGLAFRRSHAMKNHRLIHTGERHHSCPHCSKMFHVRSNLNSHIKQKHSGQFLVLEVEGGTEVRAALEESLQILASSEIIQQNIKPEVSYSGEEDEEDEEEEEAAAHWTVEGERQDSDGEGDVGEIERVDEEMQVVVEDDGIQYQVERVGGEGQVVQYAVKYVEEEVAFAYQ